MNRPLQTLTKGIVALETEPSNIPNEENLPGAEIPEGWRSKVRQGIEWATSNKVRTASVLTIVAGVMFGSITLWFFLAKKAVDEIDYPDLNLALLALDKNETKFDMEALAIVQSVKEYDNLAPDDYGIPMYVHGVIRAREAARHTDSQKMTNAYLFASRYLLEAKTRGFPSGYEEEAEYLLGKSMALSGQPVESTHYLEESLRTMPDKKHEISGLLADSFSDRPIPDYELALKYNTTALEDPTLSPKDRASRMLQHGKLLLKVGKLDECNALLAAFPPELQKQPQSNLLRAEYQLRSAEMKLYAIEPVAQEQIAARQSLSDTITLLREMKSNGTDDIRITSQISYLIGLCMVAQGKDHFKEALDQMRETRTHYPEMDEGVAAAVREAELLRMIGKPADAVTTYRNFILLVGDPSTFRNSWISLAEAKGQVTKAHRELIDDLNFEEASQLLQSAETLLGKLEVMRMQGEAYRSAAEAIERKSLGVTAWEIENQHNEALKLYRKGGQMMEEVAKLRFSTSHYTHDIWEAADLYMKGQAFSHAEQMLEEYLKYEANKQRPQALVDLGKAYLTMGKMEEAISAFKECIQLHPQDPSVFRARVSCARAFRQIENYDAAERLLLDNLKGDTLTPSAPEWKDSKFEYGFLLQQQARYDEAINELQEAIERYPDDSNAVLAQYMVADSNRRFAEEPFKKLEEVQSDNEKKKLLEIVRERLTAAEGQYHGVQKMLTVKSSNGELNRLEAALLRNSYMMRGSVLFDLRNFTDALEVYRNATGLYPTDPIVLEAYVQIANCHRRMNRKIEARGALGQAKDVLHDIPEEADFTTATNLTRTEWEQLLDSMSTW